MLKAEFIETIAATTPTRLDQVPVKHDNQQYSFNIRNRRVYSRTLKTLHLFYCSLLSEYMIYRQKYFELKSTPSLLNFDTKTEASTPVINVIHEEFKLYSEFNKSKVWGRQILIRYNMISGKKHQKPSKC